MGGLFGVNLDEIGAGHQASGGPESAADPRMLLSLLYGVIEEAERYEDRLRGTERLHDRELADFLCELRDETHRRAERAEELLAQRLANGGVQ